MTMYLLKLNLALIVAGCNRNTGWWRFDRLGNYGDDYIYYGGLSVLAALLLAVGVHRTAEE